MKRSLRKVLFLLCVLLIPIMVHAYGETTILEDVAAVLPFHIMFTVLVCFTFIDPLARTLNNGRFRIGIFIIVFIIRIVAIAILSIFFGEKAIFLDLILVFFGGKSAKLISLIFSSSEEIIPADQYIRVKPIAPLTEKEKEFKCPKCSSPLKENYKFCDACGEKVDIQKMKEIIERTPAHYEDFDPMYRLNERKMIEALLNKELQKSGTSSFKNLTTKTVLIKRLMLNTIISILLFTYITLIFLHFPNYTYGIGIIILLIALALSKKVNLMNTLLKELRARPNEKISNIIMVTKENLIKDYSKIIGFITITIAIVAPLVFFYNPKIFYEKMENGYGVRFYASGLTNNETVTIPAMYKGKKVVSLRGNAFSNMKNLKEVTLPDSITEIRGQAFLNDKKLKKVKLPRNLKSIGGSAFKNCVSLEQIEIPDTVRYIDGGAFYNATSLKSIRLPKKLAYLGGESFYNASSLTSVELGDTINEIKGDTFEYCVSLKEIKIPDSVTRIGGHAFYGDYNLKKVEITENTRLTEIGSSAFRKCDNLEEITIPKTTYVNERAFKESPTEIKYFGEENNNYYQ